MQPKKKPTAFWNILGSMMGGEVYDRMQIL